MRNLVAVLVLAVFLPAVVLGATREYDVDVYRNFNGNVRAIDGVTQSFVNTADSLLWAEFFVGAANDSGSYQLDVKLDGQRLYTGQAAAGPNADYEFVHADLSPLPGAPPLIKGKEYVLKITIPNSPETDSINWYADTTNPYQYGRMFVGGDAPLRWDLCARIEGICYNNPEMVSGWDEIPKHLVDSVWRDLRWHRYSRAVESLALDEAAHRMEETGFRGQRIVDCWYFLQPDVNNVDSFNWATGVDYCWRTLASHNVRPHLVMHGCGRWPLSHENSPVWYYLMWPTELYLPAATYDSLGRQSVNKDNHLAWFLYNYARRYGPIGETRSGEATGTFWSANPGTPYLPLRYVECNNEPSYAITSNWWTSGTLYDTTVDRMRSQFGSRLAFQMVYSRYCAVAESALEIANNGIKAEFYTPYFHDYLHPIEPDEWLPNIYQYGGGKVCEVVSLHSHEAPAELGMRGHFPYFRAT